MPNHNLTLFSGNSNRKLAGDIAKHLGVKLGACTVERFSDGEVMVQIDENVRGKDIFVIQSTCAPPNRNLMELALMVDAIRRASAARITAVVPYFGYARQDRRVHSARVPISAKVAASMICGVGCNRVLTVDLHADPIQGFFDIPVDNVYATSLLLDHIQRQSYPKATIVSPDIGGVVRARAMARQLENADLCIIDKRRARANESEVMNIIGEVDGRTCLVVDDIVDTAGTLCRGALALKENGAKKVIAYCTHAVLSGDALQTIQKSELDQLVVTDTIPLDDEMHKCNRIKQISIASTLAESLRRVSNEESISAQFGTQ
jgi:ribose-phosphate pyrophosphokinase